VEDHEAQDFKEETQDTQYQAGGRSYTEEWDKLTPADWEGYIKSMRKRCRLVIKAKGGSIKY
jgi:hypothetical protein